MIDLNQIAPVAQELLAQVFETFGIEEEVSEEQVQRLLQAEARAHKKNQKDLSAYDETRGGALVPPPKQAKRILLQRSWLGNKSLSLYQWKTGPKVIYRRTPPKKPGWRKVPGPRGSENRYEWAGGEIEGPEKPKPPRKPRKPKKKPQDPAQQQRREEADVGSAAPPEVTNPAIKDSAVREGLKDAAKDAKEWIAKTLQNSKEWAGPKLKAFGNSMKKAGKWAVAKGIRGGQAIGSLLNGLAKGIYNIVRNGQALIFSKQGWDNRIPDLTQFLNIVGKVITIGAGAGGVAMGAPLIAGVAVGTSWWTVPYVAKMAGGALAKLAKQFEEDLKKDKAYDYPRGGGGRLADLTPGQITEIMYVINGFGRLDPSNLNRRDVEKVIARAYRMGQIAERENRKPSYLANKSHLGNKSLKKVKCQEGENAGKPGPCPGPVRNEEGGGGNPAGTRAERKVSDRVAGFLEESRKIKVSKGPAIDVDQGKIFKENEWGYNVDDDSYDFVFRTSSDRPYWIEMNIDEDMAEVGGPEVREALFGMQNDKGNWEYGVTGEGNALEVFGNVLPALISLAEKEGQSNIYLTAKEPSRRKYYDKLVKRMCSLKKEMVAVAVDGMNERHYLIAKREDLTEVVGAFLKSRGHIKKEDVEFLAKRLQQFKTKQLFHFDVKSLK